MGRIQIGCFCRPWNKFSMDEFLAGVAGAGYDCVGFMRLQGELPVKPGMTGAEVDALKSAMAAHCVAPSTALASNSLGDGEEAAVAEGRAYIDAMAACGVKYYLSCGTADETHYDLLYRVLRQTAEYAQGKGVKVTLKPHGGISATNADLLHAVQRVDHPNFGIYFDPGNILYYTGGDPVDGLEELAPHVVGMCLKDETGGEKGDVNLEPGIGDVDFPAVFSVLKQAGCAGPICVECLGGEELADINERAARVRRRIDEWVA